MRKILRFCTGLLVGYASVFAQETYTLSDLVVTPTGSESDAFDTALPVSVFRARDIDEAIAFSMGDLLKREPGVDAITAGPGSIHPMIRGLYGERVLVLVNGIRLSEQRPGGNHAFSLDPAQVERAEIVRGPASVLYGSDAIAGVVNFITKRADEEAGDTARTGGETQVEWQSNGEGPRASAHLRAGKDRVNAYAGGVHTDTGDIENRDGTVHNSAYDGYTLWGGANYIGEGWKSFLDYSYMNADIGVPSPAVFSEDLFKGEKHQSLALRFEHDEGASVDFGWQRHNRHRHRRKTAGIPPAIKGDMVIDINLDIDTWNLKPRFVFTPGDVHRITIGLDSFLEDASSARTIGDTASAWVNPAFNNVPVIPDSRRYGIGAYMQDELALGDRWLITPGLRADWIEAETDGHPRHDLTAKEHSQCSALSGNLGVLYQLGHAVNLYGNAGRAFRAPTLLELYFYGPHDVANDIGNPDLDPEISWNFDLGIKTRTERVQAMAGVFYNIIDNYIAKEKQSDGNYAYKNYDRAMLYGGEAGAQIELGEGFSPYASLSCVLGKRDDTDDDLPGIPPLKARYGLRYDMTLGGHAFWAEIEGVSAAKQDRTAPNERETDGYTLGNVRIGADLGANWTLVAGVENFTDELYQDHLSSPWQEFGLSDQPGRNVKLMAKLRF